MVAINHLLLKPAVNNITIVMIKYMSTAPVSGSIKVSTEGIPTTIKTLIRNLNSSIISLLLLSALKSPIILDNVIIKNIFINSDGWKLPIYGIINQHFALLIGVPINNTSIKRRTPIIYNI